MELFVHFWEGFSDYFHQRSWDIWMSDLFLFIKTDQTVPSSQNIVEKKATRDSFIAFNSGLSRQHCVWQISQLSFFLEFLFKVFYVCPDFLCSLTQFFSPISFHSHSLPPLPLRVRPHPVTLHSGSRRDLVHTGKQLFQSCIILGSCICILTIYSTKEMNGFHM